MGNNIRISTGITDINESMIYVGDKLRIHDKSTHMLEECEVCFGKFDICIASASNYEIMVPCVGVYIKNEFGAIDNFAEYANPDEYVMEKI